MGHILSSDIVTYHWGLWPEGSVALQKSIYEKIFFSIFKVYLFVVTSKEICHIRQATLVCVCQCLYHHFMNHFCRYCNDVCLIACQKSKGNNALQLQIWENLQMEHISQFWHYYVTIECCCQRSVAQILDCSNEVLFVFS